MEFTNTQVFNFAGAMHGMRNPMNSWDRSDSWFGIVDIYNDDGSEMDVVDSWIDEENIERCERGLDELSHDMEDYDEYYEALDGYSQWLWSEGLLSKADTQSPFYQAAFLGPNDLHLAQNLILAGSEHAKFMRQIMVSVDITAPRFWWTEMDTYKVGTVANSTSTMHKLTSREITPNDFAMRPDCDLVVASGSSPHGGEWEFVYTDYIDDVITMCENLRQKYVETHDERYWRALIELLPQSYLQTRTWTANYAVLRNIYFQRKNHRLIEWHEFCDWIDTLPYASNLITLGRN